MTGAEACRYIEQRERERNMAEMQIEVEVQIRVDDNTAKWLEGQGWTRPSNAEPEPEPDYDKAEADRLRSQALYYKVTRLAGFEHVEALLESLGVDLYWLKRPGADSV